MRRNAHQQWAQCPGGDLCFSAATGTPFARLLRRNHAALYGALLAGWGLWIPIVAWRIVGCTDTKQFADFQRRLLPLFDERNQGEPLGLRPAYRQGFTPAQQGVRCPRCASDQLAYRRRLQANPQIECSACQHCFLLHNQHRHGLPLPADILCLDCGSRALTRCVKHADGRRAYRCQDRLRYFIEGNKRPGLKSRPRANKGILAFRAK